MIWLHRSQRGFTVIETLAALTVFAIMTLGLVPLLLSTIRGGNLSRSFTIGKNVAVQAMEHVRGLPYFESVGSAVPLAEPPPAGSRRDVLDLYFPNTTAGASGSGYSSATKAFTTICDGATMLPATTGSIACPKGIPSDFKVTFAAQFVAPIPATSPQQFSASGVTVPSTYNWNSNATEIAPSELLQMTITAGWTLNGKARSFDLVSLVGNRKLSDEELRADGRIDYAVRMGTSFIAPDGRISTATMTTGESSSEIDTKSVIGSDFTATAGKILLANQEFGTDPGGPLTDVVGAGTTLAAPPGGSGTANAPPATLTHPDVLQDVGFLNDSQITGGNAQVVAGQPKATGSFNFHETGVPSVWLDNQAETGPTSPLQLSSSEPIVLVEAPGARTLKGTTYAESTAVNTTGRKVHATSKVEIGRLDLFPTNFLPSNGPVLYISDFVADLGCYSTASAATATVTGTWSATFTYFDAGTDGDGLPTDVDDDQYRSISLSGNLTGTTDPFASIRGTGNPLVYDDRVDDSKDIYLFEDSTTGLSGYLRELSAVTQIDGLEDSTGRQTSAQLNDAITIKTVPTSAGIPESALSISIGKLSCEAVDGRGL
ncbi:MAG: type IV pilus modification PilV family protein [Actinomycetota bacterium]